MARPDLTWMEPYAKGEDDPPSGATVMECLAYIKRLESYIKKSACEYCAKGDVPEDSTPKAKIRFHYNDKKGSNVPCKFDTALSALEKP